MDLDQAGAVVGLSAQGGLISQCSIEEPWGSRVNLPERMRRSEEPAFLNALPVRSHPMQCSPVASGRSHRLRSNIAKNGTSAARDSFPHAMSACSVRWQILNSLNRWVRCICVSLRDPRFLRLRWIWVNLGDLWTSRDAAMEIPKSEIRNPKL